MSRSSTNWISKRRRQAIYARDSFRCLWCDQHRNDPAVQASWRTPDSELTLDHFIPTSEGGNHCNANLFTACKRHNSSRGSRSVYEYSCLIAEPIFGAGAGPIVLRILRSVAIPLPPYRKRKHT